MLLADSALSFRTDLPIEIESVDPQHADAQILLQEAAVEARALYPKLFAPDQPPPSNPPLRAREVYVLARRGGRVVGCGALKQIDTLTAELYRMLVTASHRRHGVGRQLVRALESHAVLLGYERLLLETSQQQKAARALYSACGWKRVDRFGPYVSDASSVCYGKVLSATSARSAG